MLERTFALWRRLVGSAFDAESEAAVAEERRRSVRYASEQIILCRSVGADAQAVRGRLQDVSSGGIRLVLDREFRPGDLISIQLPDASGESSTWVLACVVHAGHTAEGRWDIGSTFASELSRQQLRSFDRHGRDAALQADQRSQERHPCTFKATYQLLADEPAESWPARVLNISTTGIGLAVDQPITVGKLLNVDLNVTGRDNTRSFLCCAVHVTQQDDSQWLVGCNFINELDDSELGTLIRS